MDQREQMAIHSQELESAIAQLKAKDGQLDYCSGFKGISLM